LFLPASRVPRPYGQQSVGTGNSNCEERHKRTRTDTDEDGDTQTAIGESTPVRSLRDGLVRSNSFQ
jgi:hypothetical protein